MAAVGSEGVNSDFESAEEEDLLPAGAEADQENVDPKLDDDEDRKNPQYIPKKGTFYEHDDRTMPGEEDDPVLAEGEEGKYPGAELPVVQISQMTISEDGSEAQPNAALKQQKKKVWRGDEDRWCHDKFEEMEQSPKPREELVSVYGYDIRSEEGAPRARRRRRYGRGPNKYTRKWEDLDAYSRPARGSVAGGRGGAPMMGKGRGGKQPFENREEEYPSLPGQENNDNRQYNNENNQETSERNNVNLRSRGRPPSTVKSPSAPHDPSHYNNNSSSQQPNFNSHTFTNQEYRRRQEDGRGRGKGGTSARGRGARGRGGPGGKGSGRGGHQEVPQQGATGQRQSDDVRFSGKASTLHHSPHHQPSRHGGDASEYSPRHQEEDHQKGDGRGGLSRSAGQHQPSGAAQGTFAGKPKRYSNQRSSNSRGGSNPHYTPHPHHNLYYHDTSSTTPPPDIIANSGLVAVSGSTAGINSSAAGVVVSNAVVYDLSAPPPHATAPLAVSLAAHSQFVPQVPPPNVTFGEDSGPFLAPRAPPSGVPRGIFPPPSQQAVPPSMVRVVPAGPQPTAVIGATPSAVGTTVPAPTAPPFIPSDPSAILAPPPQQFTSGPPPHPPQFPFQPFVPVPAPPAEGVIPGGPQEVYRNGVMYYNTQSQQQPTRSVVPLQKRPKAAIPIVPPPDKNSSASYSGDEAPAIRDEEVDCEEHYALQQLQLQKQEGLVLDSNISSEQNADKGASADVATDKQVSKSAAQQNDTKPGDSTQPSDILDKNASACKESIAAAENKLASELETEVTTESTAAKSVVEQTVKVDQGLGIEMSNTTTDGAIEVNVKQDTAAVKQTLNAAADSEKADKTEAASSEKNLSELTSDCKSATEKSSVAIEKVTSTEEEANSE